jgi:HK97 family phage prohead protease
MEMFLRAFTDKESGKRKIKGLAAVFNSQSKLINEHGRTFREIVLPGAFDKVLKDENTKVKATVDHDPKMLLGRTESGTLELNIVSRGLHYTVEVPNTQLGNDTYEQVLRGDYFESSFIFGLKRSDYYWGRDKGDGMLLRYIRNISVLKDVSVVTDGAYAATNTTAETERSYKLEYLDKVARNDNSCDGEISVCQRFNSDICVNSTVVVDKVEDEQRSESNDNPTEKTKEDVVDDVIEKEVESSERKVEDVAVEEKKQETEKPVEENKVKEVKEESAEDEHSWKDFVKEKRSELKEQIFGKK